VTVLGNHDLHLLALAQGSARCHKSDTLEDILAAPDREDLLTWLRHQPLMHHDAALNATLLHAGLPPQWDLATAQACANEVEIVLRGDNYKAFFQHMYGNMPDLWSDDLTGQDRLRFITNSFTRLRYCDAAGRFDFKSKGEPGTQPKGYMPWFEVPGRRSENLCVVFGHWSALGLRRERHIISLDTGCLWGQQLTAVRLGGGDNVYCVECSPQRGSGTK